MRETTLREIADDTEAIEMIARAIFGRLTDEKVLPIDDNGNPKATDEEVESIETTLRSAVIEGINEVLEERE